MDMALQVLRAGVQHQAESGSAAGVTHPPVVGGKLLQRLGHAGK